MPPRICTDYGKKSLFRPVKCEQKHDRAHDALGHIHPAINEEKMHWKMVRQLGLSVGIGDVDSTPGLYMITFGKREAWRFKCFGDG